jgi:hypothetical protein
MTTWGVEVVVVWVVVDVVAVVRVGVMVVGALELDADVLGTAEVLLLVETAGVPPPLLLA